MLKVELTASEKAELAAAESSHIDVNAVRCSRCWGTGHLGVNFAECPRCDGSGFIYLLPVP
jgi:hypothetical protein